MKQTSRGFTLIELLVVIAIIGILSSVVLASLNSARQKSRDSRRIADVRQLQTAFELYYDSNQSYPVLGTAGNADSVSGVAGTYVPNIPVGPQGEHYTYLSLSDANPTTSACSAAPCPSYVLRASLEDTSQPSLVNDVDTVFANAGGFDCADATEGYYCVRP